MPALSVRLDQGLEKYLMLQGRLGGKRLFLDHHLFDWSSHNASFSKASCVSKYLYFWHWAKPDQWRVWNLWPQLWHCGNRNCWGLVCPTSLLDLLFQDVKIEMFSSGGRCWGAHENGGLRLERPKHFSLQPPRSDAGLWRQWDWALQNLLKISQLLHR